MTRSFAITMAALAFIGTGTAASAQPADLPIPAATTSEYPAGVRVANTPAGSVYADRSGRTLYGMDMRTVLRWSPDAAQYCQAECQKDWEPLLAPAGTPVNIRFPRGGGPNAAAGEGFVQPQRAPDWTVIAGPQGPQWVYKGWHMVYVRKGERRGSTAFDGAGGNIWNTLKFVPPVPRVAAPAGVQPQFAGGTYQLADANGRALFTGRCKPACEGWTPLTAGMAQSAMGEWTIDRMGDRPQWRYRGRPVFVSQEDDPQQIPASGQALRP